MNKILKKIILAEKIYKYTIEAPLIAKKRKAGQFFILRTHEKGERVPLTITNSDSEKGTIDFIFQVLGHSTQELALLNEGDSILDVAGPLGEPTHIEKQGTIITVGGGVGIATLYPISKAHKEIGNEVISIQGARSQELLIIKNEVKSISDQYYAMTDDGSAGEKGYVTNKLADILNSGKKIDEVIAIGPLPMMKAVSDITKSHGIKTMVSLNAIMVDGTGMCGCCRVTVGGETKFACVHGPEFDGHQVDFVELLKRSKVYECEENHICNMEKYFD